MVVRSGGLVMIKNIMKDLPESERKIADYILQNPKEIVTMTVAELGEVSGTSGSAVVRLCKSLGLNGYQDLKFRIYGDIQKDDNDFYIDISKNDTAASIIRNIKSNTLKSIDETYELLDTGVIEEAAKLIARAGTVLFCGLGASSLVAKDAQQKFLRINKNCYAFEDTHIAATTIGNMKKSDLVVSISSSGETREIIKLTELARSKGINTLAIVKYGRTSLGKVSALSIHTPSNIETPLRSAATSSRIAQLFIIDILFTCVAAAQYEDTVNYLENTKEATEIFK